MKGTRLQRALCLLGTGVVFAAAATPVQGVAAAPPTLATGPASTSLPSKAYPDPGASPIKPSPAGVQSKTGSGPKVLTAGGTWSWQNPLPDGNPLLAISCPTTSTCLAGLSDGRIRFTLNGGSTWAVQGTGISTAINSISCANTMTCVAVGNFGEVIWTSNGGASWSQQIVNGGNFLAGISCPTASTCFTAGALGAVLKSVNGGANWLTQSSGTTSNLFAISCPTSTNCIAVGAGGVATRTSDGTAWTSAGTGTANTLYGIGCSTTSVCDAVGQNGTVVITQSGGTAWTFGNTVGSTVALTSVSCPGSSACFVAGIDGGVYVLNATFNGTAAPHGSTGANGGLYAISCPAAGTCFAVGDFGTIVVTTNGATGWTQQSPRGTLAPLSGIGCASTSACIAAGDSGTILGTTDGGVTWLGQNSLTTFALHAVSCPSATNCFAGGSGGLVLSTTNGGTTWSQQSPTTSQMNGISCVSTTVCFAVGASGTIIATTNAGTSWAQQTSGTTADLNSVSCPSATVCFAVSSGAIIGTTNGGTTWAQLTTTSGRFFQSISCPSTSVCFAVGLPIIYATTNGGTTWSDQTPPNYPWPFTSVSCASTTVCTAVGSANGSSSTIFGTTDGGSHWNAQLAAKTINLSGVGCPSTTVCFAVSSGAPNVVAEGAIIATTDGGATRWHFVAPSGTKANLTSVTCPSASTCFAVGGGAAIIATKNGGTGWFPLITLQYTSFNAISCPSTSICFAVGGTNRGFGESTIYGTTDAGNTWNSLVPASTGTGSDPGYINVSCATTTACFAVAAAGTFVKTTDGTNWSAPAALSTSTSLSAISCASASVCFATDAGTPGQVFATTSGGTSWALSFNLSTDPQAGLTGPFDAISCPAITTCYAGGATGLMATTTDGGANWRTDNIPSSARLTGVSCPGAGTCYASAGDSTILYTTDYGGTWNVQSANVNAVYSGISCATTAACFAVGASGAVTATTTAGAAWTVQLPAGPTTLIRGMSCTSPSDCYAVAFNNILVTHNGGSSWTSQLAPGTDQLDAVSCPAANTCFAVGWPGTTYSTIDGGTTWTRQANSLYGSDNTFLGVSCAGGTTTCVGVGTQGKIISTTNGTTWAAETSGTTQLLTGISCPSSYSCVAVGLQGLTMTRSEGTWQAYPSGTTTNLHGVSCPNSSTCYAVGNAGTVLVTSNRGASWSAQTSGTVHDLHGVSCPQTTMCLAVGNFGAVGITLDGSSWSGLSTPTGNALRAAVFEDVNHAWVAGAGGTILANPNITPACASVSLSANPSSPQLVGTSVLLTGAATGCPNPRYRFWIQPPGGSWAVVQDYSAAATFSWNTAGGPGTYNLEVDARDASETSAYDVVANSTFILQSTPPCTTPGLTASPPSPGPTGTGATFSATTSGCPNPRYQFWVQAPGGAWSIAQAYGTASTFNWGGGGAAGVYHVEVDVRDQSETVGYDAVTNIAYQLNPCSAVTLGAAPASPQAPGTSVVLTGTPTCPGTPSYRFWVRPPGGAWTIKQDYRPASTFAWNTTGLVTGSYGLEVDVRNQGASASYEAATNITYLLGVNPCTTPTLGASPASPGATGASVTFTATTTGCPTPNYRFWVQPPGGAWSIAQNYGSANTFIWTGTGSAGAYHVEVDVRDASESVSYDAVTNITYQLNGCSAVSLGTNPASPHYPSGSVLLTGTATCPGTATYRFWVQAPGGPWTVVQNYSTTNTFSWSIAGLPLGSYGIEVDVRDQGGTNSYEKASSLTYVLAATPCATPTLGASPTSPGATGGTITFTASTSGCNMPVYRFWLKAPGFNWGIVQSYSSSNTFLWQQPATGLAGSYGIEVDVKDSAETTSYDAVMNIVYTLNGCSAAGLSASPTNTAPHGNTVTLTATSTCPAPQVVYRFWIKAPGGSWTIVQDYSSTTTFTWTNSSAPINTALPGTYSLEVDVRDQGSLETYEKVFDLSYVLT